MLLAIGIILALAGIAAIAIGMAGNESRITPTEATSELQILGFSVVVALGIVVWLCLH